MLPSFFGVLLLSGLAYGRLLNRRQEAASATSSATTTEPSDPPTNTTSSANATETDNPLNSTNDPNFCHRTAQPGSGGTITNPFCYPVQFQKIDYDANYTVTWDPTLMPANANNVIEVFSLSDYNVANGSMPPILQTPPIPNSEGHTTISVTKDWLNGSSAENLTLFLVAITPEGNDQVHSGPTITLINTDGGNSTSTLSSTSSTNKLGEEVGIPIALVIALILIVGALFILYRRRRAARGYGTRKSRSQPTSHHRHTSSSTTTGSKGRGHKRVESFHDEPTRGVELGRMSKEDDWGWGSPVGSPTAGGGNVFREEVERQKSGWGK